MNWANLDMTGMDLSYVLALLCAFALFCIVVAQINFQVVERLQRRKLMQQRLKGNKREQQLKAQIFKAQQDDTPNALLAAAERLAGWGNSENLQRQLLQADIYLSPTAFLIIIAALGFTGLLLGMSLGNTMYALGLSVFLGFLPLGFMRWKRSRKTLKIERDMPECMELLARSLRAGHTLASTLELTSREIQPPLGAEMRITYEEQRLGLSLEQAMRRLGERVASRDLHYFVTAVLIQTESGGNLAEVLENIGYIIRERLKLKGKVRGLTAEGRFSAIILALLPVVTYLGIMAVNQEYAMTLLVDPMGQRFLMAGGISIAIGALVMKRMVVIRV